jgi:hypothetical protein
LENCLYLIRVLHTCCSKKASSHCGRAAKLVPKIVTPAISAPPDAVGTRPAGGWRRPNSEARIRTSSHQHVRLNSAELDLLTKASEGIGSLASTWVRVTLLAEARKVLRRTREQ